jgi:hypothetical protein
MADRDEHVDVPLDDEKDAPLEVVADKKDKKPARSSKDDVEVVKDDDESNIIAPEDGIQELKKRLETERQARFEAEKQSRIAQQYAVTAVNETLDTNYHLVVNAIDTVKRNSENLRRGYSESMAVGDYEKAAEIQEGMSVNANRLMELERGREAMENAPRQQYEPPPMDPVENLASQLSPRSAEWVRKNPQCATDPRLFQKMVAAHNLAVADGYLPDTDEYFHKVEDTVGIGKRVAVQEDDEEPMSAAARPTQRRSAPPAAPVSRSGDGGGSRPNVVRLSREEVETAKDLGMTEQEYAKNKMLLRREGRLN